MPNCIVCSKYISNTNKPTKTHTTTYNLIIYLIYVAISGNECEWMTPKIRFVSATRQTLFETLSTCNRDRVRICAELRWRFFLCCIASMQATWEEITIFVRNKKQTQFWVLMVDLVVMQDRHRCPEVKSKLRSARERYVQTNYLPFVEVAKRQNQFLWNHHQYIFFLIL